MNLEETINRIREETVPPGELADMKLQLAAEYSHISGKLEQILRIKPDVWMEIRKREDVGSDKGADRIWEATEAGKDEMTYRLQLKKIEKVMSAIGTRLKIYEQESRNNF